MQKLLIWAITVSDISSGINYDNIYAIDEKGNTESPKYIDKASGTVQFQFDSKKKLALYKKSQYYRRSN